MRRLSFCVLLLAAACGGGEPKSAVQAGTDDIKPTDFALVPCAGHDGARPCVMVRAGGKRVLIGAPGGIAQTLAAHDLARLDSVLLFSLQAEDIEGLGEIRNRSWQAGREHALAVSGPHGTRDMVVAVNKTFEVADARQEAASERGARRVAAPLERPAESAKPKPKSLTRATWSSRMFRTPMASSVIGSIMMAGAPFSNRAA